MKLSRAIFVMLVLHVVAIGGIVAFNMIKERDPAAATANAAEAEDARVPGASPAKVAAVETEGSRAAAPAGVTRPGVRVVRQGETLQSIANDAGVGLDALVALNGASTVTDGLRPGQQLKMPDHPAAPTPRPIGPMADALQLISGKPDGAKTDAASAPALTGSKSRPPAPDSGKTYVVGKGESVYTIAQKLKVSPDALLRLNGIDDPRRLKPNQKLRVPAKAKT